jgi:hypothetical protein
MILEDIVAALKADSTLHSYIADKIYPQVVNQSDVPCIVYTFTPTTDDKIVRTDRLEIRVISKDLPILYNTDKRARQILLTFGDSPSVTGIYKATINGGGTMYDIGTDVTQLFTFYQIISRSEN